MEDRMRRLLCAAALLLAWLPGVAAAAMAAEALPLVEAAWLKAHLGEAGLVVLDVRNEISKDSRKTFEAGHVPGAVYSDYLKAGWRAKVDGVPGQLPPVADLEALVGGLGIGNGNHVVIVAGGTSALDMGSATRVYFTFKVLGHDAVSILDGGWKAWTADPANPVESGWNAPAPTTFQAAFRPALLADKTQVAAALGGATTLLDMRPAEQYQGKARHPDAKRAGTIPGARSLPESSLTEADGRFVSAERALALLRGAGAEPEGETIAFCNTGHWASLGWFVEHELLGNEQTRLYDGSMVEWSGDASLPVYCQGC